MEIPVFMELDALDPPLLSLLTQVCQGNAGNKIGFPAGSVSGVNPRASSHPIPFQAETPSAIPGGSNRHPTLDIPKVTHGWILIPGIDSGVPNGMGDDHSTFGIPTWITHPFGALGSKILVGS